MKILNSGKIMMFFLMIGCSKNEANKPDCIQSVLNEYNMVAYNGQDIGCKSYISRYQYQNEQYFLFGSPCADMISYPFDCEGNVLDEDLEFRNFFTNAERIGIIGIDE